MRLLRISQELLYYEILLSKQKTEILTSKRIDCVTKYSSQRFEYEYLVIQKIEISELTLATHPVFSLSLFVTNFSSLAYNMQHIKYKY